MARSTRSAVTTPQGNALATVESYNPTTNVWHTDAPLPRAAGGLDAVASRSRIYASGGDLDALDIYNPATNRWTSELPMPTSRSLVQAAWSGGHLYAIGGYNEVYAAGVYSDVVSDAVESYSPATGSWKTDTPIPIARMHPAVGTLTNGEIVVAGGGLADHEPLADVELYDPTADKWRALPPLLQPSAGGLTGVTLGDKFFVFGGFIDGESLDASNFVEAITLP